MFWVMVYKYSLWQGREGMVAGNRERGVLSFFTDQYPPHGMVPLTFRVDLPSSVNLSGHIFTVKLKTNHYSNHVCFMLNKKENTEDLTVLKCPSYSVKKY